MRRSQEGGSCDNHTLTQAVRHKLCRDWRKYRHTIMNVDLEVAVKRAMELKVFLEEVPYARYERNRSKRGVSCRASMASGSKSAT